MSTDSKLPKDSKVVKLGAYVESVKGKKPKRISNVKTKECPLPYVNIKAFEKGVIDEFTDGVGCVLCEEGDFLMVWDGSRSGYVGKGIKGALGSTLVKLNFPDIDNNYAYYFLQSKYLEINTRAKGVGIPHVDPNILWNYDLLIPSKKMQAAIVSKIEELFSELDNGIANLKTAQLQLKTYRQSVLKWAFEGKLTNKKVKEGELPKGWKMVNIEDIAKVGTGATPLKGNPNYYNNGKIAWVTSGALNDEFVREATDYVTELALKETNLSVYPKHTLLLAMYGEGKTRGKCSELLIEATTNQAIAAITFDKQNMAVKPYLKYFLLKNYNDIRMLSSGGVQPNLNLGIVKKTSFPFPPMPEQETIIQEIESRLSVADKLEESITQSLQQAEALRQSILKKAFEGKLV
jgi:type I restriction enzyme, S subunit